MSALVALGLGAAAVGVLDLAEWFTGAGEYGEAPWGAALRGPGGAPFALLCLLVLAIYLSRRATWSLLVLPAVAHAVLFLWQAGESHLFFAPPSERGWAVAESLGHWHLWVDLGTILLGVGVSAMAVVVEPQSPPESGQAS